MFSRRPIISQSRGRVVVRAGAGLFTNEVIQIGDSITRGVGSTGESGWREALYDHAVAENYTVIFNGTLNNGTFGGIDDRRHDGQAAAQTGARLTFIQNNCGYGKKLSGCKLWTLMMGTNDMRQAGAQYNLTNSMNRWAASIATLRAFFPRARGLVFTCLEFDPATEPEAAGRVAAFNAGLVTVWNASDAIHPGNLLIRVDAAATVGTDFATNYNADGIHLNDAGYNLMKPVVVAAADPALAVTV